MMPGEIPVSENTTNVMYEHKLHFLESVHIFTFTNLGAQMESVDVLSSRGRHLPLKVQGEIVRQEVTGRQAGAAVQSVLTNLQADHEIREALE